MSTSSLPSACESSTSASTGESVHWRSGSRSLSSSTGLSYATTANLPLMSTSSSGSSTSGPPSGPGPGSMGSPSTTTILQRASATWPAASTTTNLAVTTPGALGAVNVELSVDDDSPATLSVVSTRPP